MERKGYSIKNGDEQLPIVATPAEASTIKRIVDQYLRQWLPDLEVVEDVS